MKKFAILALSLLLMLSLVACSATGDTTVPTDSANAAIEDNTPSSASSAEQDSSEASAESEAPAEPETSTEPETSAEPETPNESETPAEPETSTNPYVINFVEEGTFTIDRDRRFVIPDFGYEGQPAIYQVTDGAEIFVQANHKYVQFTLYRLEDYGDSTYYIEQRIGYLAGNNNWSSGDCYMQPGDYYTFSFDEPGFYVITGMDEYGNITYYFFEA